jgi:hypothetical protein
MAQIRLLREDSFVVVIDNGIDEPLLGIGKNEEDALNDADKDGEYRTTGYRVELHFFHAEHFHSVGLNDRGLVWSWDEDYLCPAYDEETKKRISDATFLKKYKAKAERSKRHEQHKIKTI